MGQGALAALRSSRGYNDDHERTPLFSTVKYGSPKAAGRSNGTPNGNRNGTETSASRDVDAELEIAQDGCYPPHGVTETCPANPCKNLPVYRTIHTIRRDVIRAIGM